MSTPRFSNDPAAEPTATDYRNPLLWIERLSPAELLEWLRRAVWTGDARPVMTPHSAAPATHLANLFKEGSTELKIRLRSLLPVLVREWGHQDSYEALDALLVLTGMLRCAAAETDIGLLTVERLTGIEKEVPLRQRCLSVLAGIGGQPQTVEIFKSYLFRIDYTALCYRALFRLDRQYAARQFHAVVDVYGESGRSDNLKLMLQALLFRQLTPEQHPGALGQVLEQTPLPKLNKVLGILQTVGIILLRYEEELMVEYLYESPATGRAWDSTGATLDTTEWDRERSERINAIVRESEWLFLSSASVRESWQRSLTETARQSTETGRPL